MGFRFRKSVKMGPFRINFSKSGVGWSVGGKGYRYTKKANGGTRTTISAPGTGLSYVHETSTKKKATSTNQKTNVAQSFKATQNPYTVNNVGAEVKKSPTPQWPIKDNSIFDIFAKWMDKTFFGSSSYDIITEKVMTLALITNILGLHKVYAGRKISAVVNWVFLFFSLFLNDFMLLLILPWLVIDMIRIYKGDYGRLKSNKKFDFSKFQNLFTEKSKSKNRIAAGGVSILCVLLIAIFCPSSSSVPTELDDYTAIVSQSDSVATTSQTVTTITTTTEPTTTEPTTTTTKKTTTTKATETMVWISGSGTKYHSKSTCSGMNGPRKITLKEAKSRGYTACKRCY